MCPPGMGANTANTDLLAGIPGIDLSSLGLPNAGLQGMGLSGTDATNLMAGLPTNPSLGVTAGGAAPGQQDLLTQTLH